ncbi:MAG: hypothetical protein ACYTAO_04845, partial [Planctomycetota bacterium]
KVFWLEALDEHLERGISELADTLGEQTVWVCESNRARRFIEPDGFVMITGSQERSWKPSAREVMQHADRIITGGGLSECQPRQSYSQVVTVLVWGRTRPCCPSMDGQ